MILDNITQAAQDPILGLMVAYKADTRPERVDLGIGVYRDSSGQTPIMTAIKKAEARLLEQEDSKSYVGMSGNEAFNASMIDLVLGESAGKTRAVGIQTPGASGALRMLADVIYRSEPEATVWLSNPSYVNHAPVMRAAGLKVKYYPYFDTKTKLVDEAAMLEKLKSAGKKDVVLLHGSCHNPTGADISSDTWKALTQMAQEQGFLPFIDIAYQGFGDGLDEDAAGLRYMSDHLPSMVIAASCSKNFGLYRERTGVIIIVQNTLEQSQNIKTRILEAARATYTMPPDHGAALVEMVMRDEALYTEWKNEVDAMRERVKRLRTQLATALRKKSGTNQWDFIEQHKGMFSVLGTKPEHAQALREQHAIYMVDSGRINIAGMQESQVDYIAESLLAVTSA